MVYFKESHAVKNANKIFMFSRHLCYFFREPIIHWTFSFIQYKRNLIQVFWESHGTLYKLNTFSGLLVCNCIFTKTKHEKFGLSMRVQRTFDNKTKCMVPVISQCQFPLLFLYVTQSRIVCSSLGIWVGFFVNITTDSHKILEKEYIQIKKLKVCLHK